MDGVAMPQWLLFSWLGESSALRFSMIQRAFLFLVMAGTCSTTVSPWKSRSAKNACTHIYII